MKEKIDIRILIIIVLLIILIIMLYFYFTEDSNETFDNMNFDVSETIDSSDSITSTTSTTTTIVNTTAEVSSSLTENIELHSTYYLEESYVQTNQLVEAGEYILQYTNGTYLTAPYDCVITKINIPDEEGQCTNEHYIQISSYNALMVQFKVDETKIDKISLGQEATIEITAYDDKVLTGNVTNISSTASNGKFTVTVEFENDGDIMIGMTANVEIKG